MIRFGSIDFNSEERKAITDLIAPEDPMLSMGRNVYEFEKEFSKWIGSRYSVLVNSGTSADLVALLAAKQVLGFGEKHIIVTTSLTYPAVWNAIKLSGFTLCALDVKENSLNMDFESTKGLPTLAVHNMGKPCKDIDTTPNILVEDASEALGGKYNDKHLGTFGTLGVFSLQTAHSINTIEGGIVVTDHENLYEACLAIRDNGRICSCPICTLKVSGVCPKRSAIDETERRWKTAYLGGNFKPTEIQGVLGLVKMKKIEKTLNRRREIYLKYEEAFHNLKEENGEFIIPMIYPVKIKNPQIAVAKLGKVGIECRGMLPSYSNEYKNATEISRSYIQIPLHLGLSDKDVNYIIEEVQKLR